MNDEQRVSLLLVFLITITVFGYWRNHRWK
jgi:hypothetical protein